MLRPSHFEKSPLARVDHSCKRKAKITQSKMFGSIYIGYGYKITQDAFYPPSPEDLDVEGQDIDEFDEPNPRDPPDELEPDSDDEGKKPDDE